MKPYHWTMLATTVWSVSFCVYDAVMDLGVVYWVQFGTTIVIFVVFIALLERGRW